MLYQNVIIVIPTIRNLDFLKEWGREFKNCIGIIVEDHANLEVETPVQFFKKVHHYTWADIQQDFGKDEWIFSRRNAGIRSYGFYKAYKLGADVIITLDDDCYPVRYLYSGNQYVKQHLENLNFKAAIDWFPTYPDPRFMYTRGFPYQIRNKRPVVISHGLWSGALDLDAKTEVKLPQLLKEKPYPSIRQIILRNYFFPMCSMNLAFMREVTPLMYFPLMGYDPEGKHWGFDRYDDIWCGIFTKKILDHLNLAVVNGSPFIEHRKASKPGLNLIREQTGLKVNETLWQRVNQVKLTQNTISGCYSELIDNIKFPDSAYFSFLKKAMRIWLEKFE